MATDDTNHATQTEGGKIVSSTVIVMKSCFAVAYQSREVESRNRLTEEVDKEVKKGGGVIRVTSEEGSGVE